MEHELSSYAAGGLESSRRWEIRRHLSGCPDCAALVADFRQAGAALDLLDRTEDHPDDALLAAVAEGRAGSAQRARVLSHVSLCPECALVVGSLHREVATAAPAVPRARRVYAWGGLAAAAACMVILANILWLGPAKSPLESPPGTMAGKSSAEVAAGPGLGAPGAPTPKGNTIKRPALTEQVVKAPPPASPAPGKAEVKQRRVALNRPRPAAPRPPSRPRPRRPDSMDGVAIAEAPRPVAPPPPVISDMARRDERESLKAAEAPAPSADPAPGLEDPAIRSAAAPGSAGAVEAPAPAAPAPREGPEAGGERQPQAPAMPVAVTPNQARTVSSEARPQAARPTAPTLDQAQAAPAPHAVKQKPKITPKQLRNRKKIRRR